MDIAEKIHEIVMTLPAAVVQEVLDFVEFLEKRQARTNNHGFNAQTEDNKWPDIILFFEGIPEMPPFEQDRAFLYPPAKDPVI